MSEFKGNNMTRILAVLLGLGTPAMAGPDQDKVLACFAEMGFSTTWNQCLNTMFASCAEHEIGSPDHLACLTQARSEWQQAKIDAETGVLEVLTETGFEELSGLMLAWPKFVEDKCEVVAASRSDISAEAARLGCHISEFALLTNEFTACLNGRSTEAYCQLKVQ